MHSFSYIYIFFQSNFIEVFVYHLFYRKQKTFSETLRLTTFSNSITHPIVFFGFMAFPMSYIKSIILAESFAIISETFLHSYFGKMSLVKTFPAAFVSNLISWQFAPVLTYLLFFY
jgi:tryptophanyl-tRNA synthetase